MSLRSAGLTLLVPLLLAACQSHPATPPCDMGGVVLMDAAPSERTALPIPFRVYLPPCYDAQPQVRYPVLYLLYGRGGSEMTWIDAGGIDVADRMMLAGELPRFIIVTPGYNEDDRLGDSLAYDLLPYVDAHYRTRTEVRYRAVAGASLGAIFAARLAFQHPDLFGRLACFGGAAVDGEQETLTGWIAAIPVQDRPVVLIDIGQEDTMLFSGEILTGILDANEYPYRFHSGSGGHAYDYWTANLEEFAFEWIAEGWR